MGSIHQLIKIISNLASLLDPTRPLLKKENITNNKIQWLNSHTRALEKIKAEISKITEKKFRQKAKFTPKVWRKPHRPRGCPRTTIPRRVVPNSIRQSIFKWSRTKIQHKRNRTTLASMGHRPLQILSTRIKVWTHHRPHSVTFGTKPYTTS